MLSRSTLSKLAVVLGLVAALALPAAAAELTVGPNGSGAQFVEIQSAVDAALPDDVILVRPGTYARFVVTKPVRILGDGTGPAIVAGIEYAVRVQGLPQGTELVLSGLSLQATGSSEPVVLVADALGTVVLHDLVWPLADDERAGLQVEDCARVFLLDSLVRGGVVGGSGNAQRGAVLGLRAQLWIANSEIRGTDGDPSGTQQGAHGLELEVCELRLWSARLLGGDGGGAGLRATTSRVELYGGLGAEIRGGGGAYEPSTGASSPGGPGLSLGLGCTVIRQGAQTIEGGLDGLGLVQAPSIADDGSSTQRIDPLLHPTLTSSAPQAALGSSIELTMAGTPTARHTLYLSLHSGPTLARRAFSGYFLLDPTQLFVLPAVVLPAAGKLTLSLPIPADPVLLGRTLFLQTLEYVPGRFAFGNPALVTITR